MGGEKWKGKDEEKSETKGPSEEAEQQPPASQWKPLMSGVPGIKSAGGEAGVVGDESESPGDEERIYPGIDDVIEEGTEKTRRELTLSETPGKKIIVLIPTRDRPGYLGITVKSVLEQAKHFGHDVEVVVSDQSTGVTKGGKPKAELNEASLKKLSEKFDFPVHYYHVHDDKLLNKILKRANRNEKNAFSTLVPENGKWGAHRNRLTLLAVYHGGPNAAYLHLDDDTSLLEPKEGKLAQSDRDILGAFLYGFDQALKQGKPGYSGGIQGVYDVSCSVAAGKTKNRQDQVNEVKKAISDTHIIFMPSEKGGNSRSGGGYGPSCILSFESMKQPYLPYGGNEDWMHTIGFSNRFGLNPFFPEGMENYDHPMVFHIGARGHTFESVSDCENPTLYPSSELESAIPVLAEKRRRDAPLVSGWNSLVEKTAQLKDTTSSPGLASFLRRLFTN